MTKTLDLAVIGAGIIGSFVARYARAAYPGWRISLFDQSLAGSGASHYSATLDFPYGHTSIRRQLTTRSRALYQHLKKELPGLPFRELPFYGFIQKDKGEALLQQFTDPMARLSPQELPGLASQMPGLQLPEGTTVLTGTQAQYATSNDIASLLGRKFSTTALSNLFESTRITSVIPEGNLIRLKSADGRSFECRRVVLATGPWQQPLLPESLPFPQKIRVKKVVAFHINRQPSPTDPVLYFFDDEAFLMPRIEAGYWLFSFRCDHWDVSPNAPLDINEGDRRKALHILGEYFPALISHCNGGRVFCDGYTDNGDPVIASPEGYPNIIIAGAGAGSGFRLAPGIAEKTVSLLQQD